MAKFLVRKKPDNSNDGYTETIKYYVMHQANVISNHNKFYLLELQKNPDGRYRIYTNYGRLGISQIHEARELMDGQPCLDISTVEAEFESIHAKKLQGKSAVDPNTGERVKEAYVDIEVVSPTIGSENIRNKNADVMKRVTEKAAFDISSYTPQTADLLEQLIQENIHAITSQSAITYSIKGEFLTPLGSVTKEHCDKARMYLDQLGAHMDAKGVLIPESPEIRKIHNQYFSLIPHKFSRKIATEDMITDVNKLQLEYDLLDQLSTAVQMGSALCGNTSQRLSALGTDILILDDLNDIKRIKGYLKNSRALNHRNEDVWNFEAKAIYRVKIPEERNRFESYSKGIGNVKELIHGSANCNVLSLLKTGMKQTSVNSPGVTGKMFGEQGLYFSDSSTKSLRYSLGYWGSKRSKYGNAFIFIANVALGKTFEMRSGSYPYKGAKPGYDSTSAYAHPGFLYNNEYITYHIGQNTFTYLVEMTPYGR